MILYLDTSSLIKLYVEEKGSETVRQLLVATAVAATSVVAYAEARSALARLRREGGLAERQYLRARADLEDDFQRLMAIPVMENVWRHAGELVERHALRGFDGIHLASFLWLAAERRDLQVTFSSWDERLTRAAQAEVHKT